MKRFLAITCAILLLAALASGCKKESALVLATEPEETSENLWTFATLPETETEPVEPTDEESPQDESGAASTTKTNIPVLSGNASATTRTTTAASTTSTTKSSSSSSSATTTTRPAGGAISISSKEEALRAFNSAVQQVTGGKAGFAKSHLITSQDWAFDQGFLESVNIPFVGAEMISQQLSGVLNTALGKGLRTSTAGKGSANSLISASAFTMADMKDVTWSGGGQQWTVTLSVKDGETRQKKGGSLTGSSPIDKGPLSLAANSPGLYDHMNAGHVFSLVKTSFSFVNVEPIDISESTSQVVFTAKLDAQGRLTELKATFRQTINLNEIKVLNGLQSYKDNKGSSSVTVTYDSFVY